MISKFISFKNKNYLLSALWIGVVLLLYVPLLLNGGIIIDDWGGLASNFQCNGIFDACFRERYLDAFYAVFANRPLAPLPIVLSTVLFKTNFSWYLYANTTIYLASILITAWVINKIANQLAAIVFSYISIIPFISMPLVVSPINLMDSTLAYLFWSLSIFLLYIYCNNKSYLAYVSSYFLLVLGFFTYEVFLPLLILNALIPYIVNRPGVSKNKFKYFLEYFFPLLVVLTIVYAWQKVIGPNYFQFASRLRFEWNNVVPSFISWANIFLNGAPQLFLKSLKHISPYVLVTSLAFVFSLGTSCLILNKRVNDAKKDYSPYLFACFVCFIGSSGIFILSGAEANFGGYEARALSSTWIAFALLSSGLATVFLKYWPLFLKRMVGFVCLLFLFFSCICFSISRDNYIKSWEIQTLVIQDALEQISNNKVENLATIIGNVPQYVPKNFNDELVFNTYWDFTAALQVYTKGLIKGGPVIDGNLGNFHNLRIINRTLFIDGLKISNYDKLWFYDFDQTKGVGSLTKIFNDKELKSKLTSLGNPIYLGEIEQSAVIERGEVLDFSKDWINRHHFLKSGFSERESWGVWSSGKEAELWLPLPSGDLNGLRLYVRAFITPKQPEQRVEVIMDDKLFKTFYLKKAGLNLIDIPLSPRHSPPKGFIKIRFNFLDAVSPKQVDIGDDPRLLAIGFEKAVFY